MQYKNGREAKNGDRVLNVATGKAGILHSTNAQATSCNGRIAATSDSDSYVNISDCLHLDDIAAIAPKLPVAA